MAVKTSGTLYITEVAAEFGGGAPYWISTYYRTPGGIITANNTGVPTGGPIFMSQFYGTSKIVPGAWDVGTPGTYTVNIGFYNWLRMRAWGAGGSGGVGFTTGNAGTFSRVLGYIQANGGQPGGPANGGAGGSGTGGNQDNATGGTGAFGGGNNAGGNCPLGGAGGAAGDHNGGFPGGGGGGTSSGGGGGGGFAHSLFGAGGPITLTVTVGQGGVAPAGAGSGGNGRVLIEWG